MPDPIDKAAVYIRVGGQHTELNEARQHEAVTAVVRERGYDLGKVYRDYGPGRSAFQRMLADAQAGEFQVLVAFRLDRLARTAGELIPVLELVDAGDCRVELAQQSIDLDDTTGRLAARIMATAYEAEDEYARTRQEAAGKMRDSHWRRRKGER